MSKKSKNAEAPVTVPVPSLTSIESLNETCRPVISLAVRTPKGMRSIDVRPLSPREMGEVRDIIEAVIPPFTKKADGTPSDSLDFSDSGYRRRLQEAKLLARSVALWHAVPMFRSAAPQGIEKDRMAIHNWLLEQANDSLLEQIWLAVSSDFTADRLEEAVSFTMPPA